MTGSQWAVGVRPWHFDGALKSTNRNGNGTAPGSELKGFFIHYRTEHIGVILAIHRGGVPVEHPVHAVQKGLPPPGVIAPVDVLMAHRAAASSFFMVLMRQRRVGLHQQHEPQ